MAKNKILLVEDDLIIAEDTKRTLHVLGYEVIAIAISGKEALDHVSKNPPDLVILDITMPGLNGRQVHQRLRQNPCTQDIPVIFCTASTEINLASPHDDYLAKPADIKQLYNKILKFLPPRRNNP